jgi:AraC-like DNA-binding protein
MSPIISFVSFFNLRKRNAGTYNSPFSGVGTEFFPLGILPDHSGFTLHETGYLPHNNWWRFLQVLSPFWRFYYNFQKGHKIIFRDGEVELTPKHIVLIPDQQLFDSVGTNPVPHFWMAFSPAKRIDIRQKIPILLQPDPCELELIRKIAELYNGRAECSDRNRGFGLSIALLSIVLSRPEIKWQQEDSPRMEKASRFIENHYASALSIRETAKNAGMSHGAFIKAFKRYQGVTPVRFLMQTRIRQVADLLVNTDSTIDDVAERAGFPNRAYMSRVFKKITGLSPAQFRTLHASP